MGPPGWFLGKSGSIVIVTLGSNVEEQIGAV